MAIQPIDIQTLFSQLEKISKIQSHQTQGLQLHNAIDEDEKSKQDVKKRATVEETHDLSNGIEHTKEWKRSRGSSHQGGDSTDPESSAENEEELTLDQTKETIKDPRLGQHIDVSG